MVVYELILWLLCDFDVLILEIANGRLAVKRHLNHNGKTVELRYVVSASKPSHLSFGQFIFRINDPSAAPDKRQ